MPSSRLSATGTVIVDVGAFTVTSAALKVGMLVRPMSLEKP
jgi:hypothetical protein